MVFGIVLNRNGWRIDYLGMNTPVEELTRTVDARHPDLVVLAATLPENLEPLAAQLTALARRSPLALAGAGATPQIAAAVGKPSPSWKDCQITVERLYSILMEFPRDSPLLRIGELSRRLGVSDHVLRAWENRYGLLQPVRSPGGFRLYSEADEWRIRQMQAYLADGLSAAEAARAALSGDASTPPGRPAGPPLAASAGDGLSAALRQALDAFDEPAAQAVLDRLLADLSVPAVLRDVVLPYLADLGERWQRGTASVAMEHFASNVIRGRLAGLARGWGSGHGPQALLACPPGELHDMALMVFGIVLHRNGWRIGYLGANTPIEELERTIDASHPDLVVLAATIPDTLEPLRPELASLARRAPLALAGAGATAQTATAAGARLIAGDPVTEAERTGWSR